MEAIDTTQAVQRQHAKGSLLLPCVYNPTVSKSSTSEIVHSWHQKHSNPGPVYCNIPCPQRRLQVQEPAVQRLLERRVMLPAIVSTSLCQNTPAKASSVCCRVQLLPCRLQVEESAIFSSFTNEALCSCSTGFSVHRAAGALFNFMVASSKQRQVDL